MRGATTVSARLRPRKKFQSTLLMRGATPWPVRSHSSLIYFNPRSSCEERPSCSISSSPSRNFNPRSSCEERLYRRRRLLPSSRFQSTLLMRGATSPASAPARADLTFQSTLLMRGATAQVSVPKTHFDFNPRSSCEERLFLLGPPAFQAHFNPRSSCEERLAVYKKSFPLMI